MPPPSSERTTSALSPRERARRDRSSATPDNECASDGGGAAAGARAGSAISPSSQKSRARARRRSAARSARRRNVSPPRSLIEEGQVHSPLARDPDRLGVSGVGVAHHAGPGIGREDA